MTSCCVPTIFHRLYKNNYEPSERDKLGGGEGGGGLGGGGEGGGGLGGGGLGGGGLGGGGPKANELVFINV